AIMGKSGEGKSTLLHILGTLERPCLGELEILNKPVTAARSILLRRHQIGFIFQAHNLLEDFSVLENILMPAQIARLPISITSASYRIALDFLERVGLKQRADFPAKLLSGGEKQRVAIARAFCNDPSLILADEPSGNLDRNNSRTIHQLLIQAAKDNGKTLIVATHDQELANLCDRLLILKEGNVKEGEHRCRF
ncbi:MAG: ABC transporter ATP-binding protein, partial [Anaerolineae bacterium]